MAVNRCIRFSVAFGIALALCCGCAMNKPAPQSAKTVKSMKDVYGELGNAKLQVDRTMAYLDELSRGGNTQQAFKSYGASISDLQEAAKDAEERGKHFRAKRDEYLAKWQAETETIQSPDIKETSEQRRLRVQASFEKITAAADEARAAYTPFIASLQDIQKSLTVDLTPAGIKAAQPAIDKAKSDGTALNKKIDALGIQLDTLMGKLKPAGTN